MIVSENKYLAMRFFAPIEWQNKHKQMANDTIDQIGSEQFANDPLRKHLYECQAKHLKRSSVSYVDQAIFNHLFKADKITDEKSAEWFMAKQKAEEELESLLKSDSKFLLIKDSAKQEAEKIKINHNFNLKFLSNSSNENITYITSENDFFRYYKVGKIIFGCYIRRHDEDYIEYHFFKLNTETNTIDVGEGAMDFDISPYFLGETSSGDVGFQTKYVRFIQLVVWTQLSELEYVVVKPKGRIGTRKNGKIANDSQTSIVVVDSSWNKVIIRTEGFSVSGHFRLQPCGKNRSKLKLVYVKPHQKSGYVRGAKRIAINGNNKTIR